jgi:chromosomal replication initiation ATPase DnaA
MRAAANHFGVSVFDLKIQRRQAAIVWRRHVAMYLAYKLTTRSPMQKALLRPSQGALITSLRPS